MSTNYATLDLFLFCNERERERETLLKHLTLSQII